MKTLAIGFTTIALAVLSTQTLRADERGKPALLPAGAQRVFTPHGFDSNDNVQVVVDDELASTCYKSGPVTTTVDQQNKTIRVQNHSYFYEGCWCADVVTPYFRAVDLGVLDPGVYSVITEDESGRVLKKGDMRVTLATNLAPDDYLYAPVANAVIEKRANRKNPVLTISGEFTNSCMHLKEIRPTYSPENVIEVLPIAEMDDKACSTVMVPFKASIELTNVPKGRTLIHVRSLNGQAVNQVVSF